MGSFINSGLNMCMPYFVLFGFFYPQVALWCILGFVDCQEHVYILIKNLHLIHNVCFPLIKDWKHRMLN